MLKYAGKFTFFEEYTDEKRKTFSAQEYELTTVYMETNVGYLIDLISTRMHKGITSG